LSVFELWAVFIVLLLRLEIALLFP